MSGKDPLRVFVSYEIAGARQYAEAAFQAFQEVSVSAWVWHLHRRSGAYLRTEIAERIGEADFVLFICTRGTRDAPGQRFEINNAGDRDKDIWVVTFDDEFVPPALLGYVYDCIDSQPIGEICRQLVEQLGKPTWPTIEGQQIMTDETAEVTT